MTVCPVKVQVPGIKAMFEAHGFERDGDLAYPSVGENFCFGIPFVIPVQGQIVQRRAAVCDQSFTLHTKRRNTKLETVGLVFVDVKKNIECVNKPAAEITS